jgi:hypothetical protein
MPLSILNLRYLSMAVFILLYLVSSDAQAQTSDLDLNKIWTTVGSTGTLDKNDISKVFFDHSSVQMGLILGGGTQAIARNPSLLPVQTESAIIRYNITPVDGVFPPPIVPGGPGVQMTLRYAAVLGRVDAKLFEVDLNTGGQSVLLTFDSAAASHISDDYHVDKVAQCGPVFDFLGKAYFIEATLTHNVTNAVGSAAGIQIIKVSQIACPGGVPPSR